LFISTLLLDTNLLVLFIVGSTNKAYIARHKRLKAFTADDFNLLLDLVNQAEKVMLTPNTLTETSNLIRYIEEPAKTEILDKFSQLVQTNEEVYLKSRDALKHLSYRPLGLADAVLLNLSEGHNTLATTDLNLYLSAIADKKPAINFNHLRDRYLS
jgi:predicted nucleic acid-binding protein